jgi:hypothetical protein
MGPILELVVQLLVLAGTPLLDLRGQNRLICVFKVLWRKFVLKGKFDF